MMLAGIMVTAGLVIAGLAVAQLKASNWHPQMAQATQPLRSTPGAEQTVGARRAHDDRCAAERHSARTRASRYGRAEGRRPHCAAARAGGKERAADQGKIAAISLRSSS